MDHYDTVGLLDEFDKTPEWMLAMSEKVNAAWTANKTKLICGTLKKGNEVYILRIVKDSVKCEDGAIKLAVWWEHEQIGSSRTETKYYIIRTKVWIDEIRNY